MSLRGHYIIQIQLFILKKALEYITSNYSMVCIIDLFFANMEPCIYFIFDKLKKKLILTIKFRTSWILEILSWAS